MAGGAGVAGHRKRKDYCDLVEAFLGYHWHKVIMGRMIIPSPAQDFVSLLDLILQMIVFPVVVLKLWWASQTWCIIICVFQVQFWFNSFKTLR